MQHTKTNQTPRGISIDLEGCLNKSTVLLNLFRSLPFPALLIDRQGCVRFVNAQAKLLIGHSAIGNSLGHYVTFDLAQTCGEDSRQVAHWSTTSNPAGYATGWLRSADAPWIAVKIRFEPIGAIRAAVPNADTIAILNERHQESGITHNAAHTLN